MEQNFTAPTAAEEEVATVDIKDLLSISLSKWYWFIISVIVTMFLATLYILYTPPVYTRTTTILIKDDEERGNPLESAMKQFNLSKTSNMIQNEILSLKAVSLMTTVVERLNLNDTYHTKNGLRSVDLYHLNPVSVTMIDSVNSVVGFKFEVDKAGRVKMWDFKDIEGGISGKAEGSIGKTIDTPVGKVIFSRTPWYNEKYLDETISFNHSTPLKTAKFYVKEITIDLGDKDANVLNISIKNSSIAKADDLLNTLVQAYNERWITDKNQVAVATERFINDRLISIERELGDVDTDISAFKSENLLPDLEESSKLYLAQSTKNQEIQLELNNQLYMAKYLRKEMASNNIDIPLPSNSGIDNSALEQQISEYNTMVLERNRLIAASSESNPLVKDLTASLKSLHSNILISLDNAITSIDTQLRGIKGQEATTSDRLAASPNQAKYLMSVGRQQKVKESLYLFLLEKREENQLSQAFSTYNTRIIDPPFGEDKPTSPRTMMVMLVAFMCGLLIPFGIIFLRETFNTRVRGKKDIESLTMPLVGEIPAIKDENHNGKTKIGKKRVNAGIKDLVVSEGKRDIVNEAFRVLRTNLEFMGNKEKGCKVVMITSFNPGSGKSLICMNLAASLGLKGKRVLVIDSDLRRTSASAFVDSPRNGLSDYLSGAISDYRKLIVHLDEARNVDVLPVGTIPPNPSELLSEPSMTSMVSEIKADYDYILLDCPPIDIVADTAIVSKLAERTIFVIRAGVFERTLVPELEKLYRSDRFNNMSLILNNVQTTGSRYGYRYGYKYGYGYAGYDKL